QSSSFDPTKPGSRLAEYVAKDPTVGIDFALCERTAYLSDVADLSEVKTGNVAQAAARITSALAGGLGSRAVGGDGDDVAGTMLSSAAGGQACGSVSGQSKSTSCDAYKTGDSFKAELMMAALKEQEADLERAQCKTKGARKAAMVNQCFEQEYDRMNEVMRAIKKEFENEVLKMQAYVTDVKKASQEEQKKIETLTGKQRSINDTLQRAEGLVRKINAGVKGDYKNPGPDTLSGLKMRLNQFEAEKRSFEITKQNDLVDRTARCFQGEGTASSTFSKCPNINGDLTSPYDCILRLFEEGARAGLNDPSSLRLGRRERNQFAQRIDRILKEVSGETPRYKSIDSFLKAYGPELQRYGEAGTHMINEMRSCKVQIEGDIKDELTNPKTRLGGTALGLAQNGETISSEFGAMILELDAGIRDAGREVFGSELNELVNGFNCRKAVATTNTGNVDFMPVALRTQMRCAEALSANIEAMITGIAPPGMRHSLVVPLNVPGLDGSPATCKGLRDCHQKTVELISAAQTRKTDLEGDGTFRDKLCPGGCPGLRKFAREASTNIQQAAKGAVENIMRRVLTLKMALDRTKAILTASGVEFPAAKVEDSDVSALCPIDEANPQLCKIAPNFDKQLAAMAGVPSITPEAFDAAKKSAKEEEDKSQKIAGDVEKNLEELKTGIEVCKKKAFNEMLEKALADGGTSIEEALELCKESVSNPQSRDDILAALKQFDNQLGDLNDSLADVCDGGKYDSPVKCGNIKRKKTRSRAQCNAVAENNRKQEEKASKGGSTDAAIVLMMNEMMKKQQ
ncbi:MAG: hypothetical protein AB1540_17290, partial [Bdellovibrionota bacterium]